MKRTWYWVISLGTALIVVWQFCSWRTENTAAAASRTAASPRQLSAASPRLQHTGFEPRAANAHRLVESDRELIDPELVTEAGPLVSADGAVHAQYVLRIPKRTIAVGEPFEASLAVHDDAGRKLPFRLVARDIVRSDGGYTEPGGTWSEQPTESGVSVTWTPGELPAPTGARELTLSVSVGSETSTVSGAFAIASGSPITLNGKVSAHRQLGALVIDVELEAKNAWTCELTANLFDVAGQPLQHTTWSGDVGPGRAHAALEFSQDIQADTRTLTAPVVVRHFRGACRDPNDAQRPPVPVPTVDELYRSG